MWHLINVFIFCVYLLTEETKYLSLMFDNFLDRKIVNCLNKCEGYPILRHSKKRDRADKSNFLQHSKMSDVTLRCNYLKQSKMSDGTLESISLQYSKMSDKTHRCSSLQHSKMSDEISRTVSLRSSSCRVKHSEISLFDTHRSISTVYSSTHAE